MAAFVHLPGRPPSSSLNFTALSGGVCDSVEDSELKPLLISALFGFIALAVVSVSLLMWYWDGWYSSSASTAFLLVDRDGSGRVDRDELYSGILQLYSAVPIKVYPPSRHVVGHILEILGLDHEATLDAEEFAHVMAYLSAQLLGRLALQLIFLLACPLTAGVVWTYVNEYIDASDSVRLEVRHTVPHWVRCGGSILAELHLGPLLLTALLMLPLDFVVRSVERLAAAGARLMRNRACCCEAACCCCNALQDSWGSQQQHRRRSQIAVGIKRLASSSPLLASERMSLGM